MRLRTRDYLLLLGVVLLAGYLRLTGLDWDGYRHYHPDERYIVWVGTTIAWPSDEQDFFDPRQNPLNPFYWPAEDLTAGGVVPLDEPRAFAYGHLPLYMGVGVMRLIEEVAPAVRPWLPGEWLLTRDILNGDELIEFRHLLVVGRMVTGLIDIGTILLTFWLGRRLFGTAAGLWAAALLAVTVLHIQLAHFFTTDPYTTFFVTAALCGMVAAVMARPSRQAGAFYVAAVLVGLAVGSKFSAVVLGAPLLLAAWLSGRSVFWWRSIVAGVLAVIAFAVTNPFALLDNNCEAITPATTILGYEIPAIDWQSCYLENIGRQSVMVQGGAAFPFTRQYDGTTPYLYFVEMQVRWGMGWLLGIVAFAGFVWVIGWCGVGLWRGWRGGKRPSAAQMGCLLLLGWCVPYFISTGNFYVKFMRYLQPIIPLLILFGVGMIWSLPWQRLKQGVLAVVWGRIAQVQGVVGVPVVLVLAEAQ